MTPSRARIRAIGNDRDVGGKPFFIEPSNLLSLGNASDKND